MVFEKASLIGSSPEGFDEAVDDAIERARETLDDVHWVEVDELGVELATADNREYQAEVTVAYDPEE